MTYNDNVICSLAPLLWWSAWSSVTIRALVPLYHPGTLLYAAREAPLSSYQQGDTCSLWLSKGKSFRKWDVHPSSHQVTFLITKMTHLHNCPKVMRSLSGFRRRRAPDGLKPSTEVHANAHFNVKSRPCHTFCSLDSFMNVFALVRFNSRPFSLTLRKGSKTLSLRFKQESKDPRVRPQRHLLKYSWGCVWMFTWCGAPRPLPSFLLPLPPESSWATSGTPRAHN